MRVVAIIQARLDSIRLPGKILLPLAGRHMLWHIIDRVKRATLVDRVVLTLPAGDYKSKEMSHFRLQNMNVGVSLSNADENNLISRYFFAACEFEADLIVRICADNPFVEPWEIDRAIQYYMEYPAIYVSNMHQHDIYAMHPLCRRYNGYPDGIGCEVFSFSRLKWMHETIKDPLDREHPHLYFHRYGLISSPQCQEAFSRPDLKLDVNTPEEYEYVKDIFEALYPKNPQFHITDVIRYIDEKNISKRKVSA